MSVTVAGDTDRYDRPSKLQGSLGANPRGAHFSDSPDSPRRSGRESNRQQHQSLVADSQISGLDIHNSNLGGANTSTVSNHYEVPNLSSMLYEYTNKEMDRVKQSFRIGNFHSLRDLPRHLLPGNVSQISRSKIESNLYSHIQEKQYIELTQGGGFFSKFEWQGDPYENFLESQRLERMQNVEKRQEVHQHRQFVSHPQVEKKFVHQNPFTSHLWAKGSENAVIGYLSENDPYEANAFEVLRVRWISDSKKLYGDFIPSYGSKDLTKVNRAQLPEIVGYIKRRLLTDWSDINFIIGTNPEDYIELRFSASSLDAPSGLKAYMSTLVDQDDQMMKFQLRRVAQYWGLKSVSSKKKSYNTNDSDDMPDDVESNPMQASDDETYVYYMLAPWWARQRNPVLYLQQFSN